MHDFGAQQKKIRSHAVVPSTDLVLRLIFGTVDNQARVLHPQTYVQGLEEQEFGAGVVGVAAGVKDFLGHAIGKKISTAIALGNEIVMKSLFYSHRGIR